VNGVDMFKEDLDGEKIVEYELCRKTNVKVIN